MYNLISYIWFLAESACIDSSLRRIWSPATRRVYSCWILRIFIWLRQRSSLNSDVLFVRSTGCFEGHLSPGDICMVKPKFDCPASHSCTTACAVMMSNYPVVSLTADPTRHLSRQSHLLGRKTTANDEWCTCRLK